MNKLKKNKITMIAGEFASSADNCIWKEASTYIPSL